MAVKRRKINASDLTVEERRLERARLRAEAKLEAGERPLTPKEERLLLEETESSRTRSSKGKDKSESARARALVAKFRAARDAATEEAIKELAGSADLLEKEPRLSKGVRGSLYREVSAATKAAYRRKSYKPKKNSSYRKQMHQARKEIVEKALQATGGNVAKAARRLEVDPDTIYEAISA